MSHETIPAKSGGQERGLKIKLKHISDTAEKASKNVPCFLQSNVDMQRKLRRPKKSRMSMLFGIVSFFYGANREQEHRTKTIKFDAVSHSVRHDSSSSFSLKDKGVVQDYRVEFSFQMSSNS